MLPFYQNGNEVKTFGHITHATTEALCQIGLMAKIERPITRKLFSVVGLFWCARHGIHLAGASPVAGSYRQA